MAIIFKHQFYITESMTINTNTWNVRRYGFYAPFYDLIANIFKPYRRMGIQSLDIQAGDHVLIVGAGTGLDLPYITDGAQIIATDITPAMVHRCRLKAERLQKPVSCLVMDGQKLQFEDESFDHVILHLILAVIPDPKACITEVERVLRRGGKISVFDKFVRDQEQVSWFRKVLNPLANFFFSDINRSLHNILKHTDLQMKDEQKGLFGGFFGIYLIKK